MISSFTTTRNALLLSRRCKYISSSSFNNPKKNNALISASLTIRNSSSSSSMRYYSDEDDSKKKNTGYGNYNVIQATIINRNNQRLNNILALQNVSTSTNNSFSMNNKRYFFSSSKSKSEKEKEEEDAFLAEDELDTFQGKIISSVLTPSNQRYLLMGGGLFGAYLISKGFLSLTNFFSHLNPQVVVKYGFYTGFGTATLLGGMGLMTLDNLYIRADPVFQYCRKKVQRNRSIINALGDGIETGDLRSYRLDSGRFELRQKKSIITTEEEEEETKISSSGDNSNDDSSITKKKTTTTFFDKIGMPHYEQVWRPPRIQMIFDITATGPPYRTGLVTCEAIKRPGYPGKLETTLLMVDYETGDENDEEDHTIYIRGNEEHLTRVSSRSGLSLKMLAHHMPINKAIADAGEKEM